MTADVLLTAMEEAASDDGVILHIDKPEITVYADCVLEGPQAHQLAVALLNAADTWDGLNR
jgi:phosphotransacetylase